MRTDLLSVWIQMCCLASFANADIEYGTDLLNTPMHLCGERLSNFLSQNCDMYPSPLSGRVRLKRSIVDECCKKPCTRKHLIDNYCAKPKKTYLSLEISAEPIPNEISRDSSKAHNEVELKSESRPEIAGNAIKQDGSGQTMDGNVILIPKVRRKSLCQHRNRRRRRCCKKRRRCMLKKHDKHGNDSRSRGNHSSKKHSRGARKSRLKRGKRHCICKRTSKIQKSIKKQVPLINENRRPAQIGLIPDDTQMPIYIRRQQAISL